MLVPQSVEGYILYVLYSIFWHYPTYGFLFSI